MMTEDEEDDIMGLHGMCSTAADRRGLQEAYRKGQRAAFKAGHEAGYTDGYNAAGIDEGYTMAAEPLGEEAAFAKWMAETGSKSGE